MWPSLAPLARSLIAQQQPLQHRMRVLTAAPEVTSSRVSSAGCLRRVRGAVPCRASAPLQQCAGVRQGLRLAHGVQQRAVLRVNNRCSRALVVVSASATGKELVPDTEFTITKACPLRPVPMGAHVPRLTVYFTVQPPAGVVRVHRPGCGAHAARGWLPRLLQLCGQQRGQQHLGAAPHLWLPHFAHRCGPPARWRGANSALLP